MDISDYRLLQQKLRLNISGAVPDAPKNVGGADLDAILDRLGCAWQFIKVARTLSRQRRGVPASVTDAQTWVAYHKWFTSHHAFVPSSALIAFCLDQAVAAGEGARVGDAREWAGLASRMRKGGGALFLYGIDFEPCCEIYCGALRSAMPAGFSGFWIRERQYSLQPAMVRFLAAFPHDAALGKIRETWDLADRRYHALHIASMHKAVKDGNSLAMDYRVQMGRSHPITDSEYNAYDEHFAIVRSSDVDRLDYIFQLCHVFEKIAADLISSHGLDNDVVDDLLDGMMAAVCVFGRWFGPVPETSRFYPKALRGE